MQKSMCIAVGMVCAATLGMAAELNLSPTKDVRIMGHSTALDMNGGASTRLRTTGIARAEADIPIMDFDRAAIKEFLEKNAGKTVIGKLHLHVRELHRIENPVNLEVASIDAASEWVEGTGAQVQAAKGESCATAARFDEQKWTLPNGAEVANFRDLVWDGAAVRGVGNSKRLAIAKDDGGKRIELELDAALIRHMGTSANCKGIFLFHRDASAMLDFYSREQAGKGPVLILTVTPH